MSKLENMVLAISINYDGHSLSIGVKDEQMAEIVDEYIEKYGHFCEVGFISECFDKLLLKFAETKPEDEYGKICYDCMLDKLVEKPMTKEDLEDYENFEKELDILDSFTYLSEDYNAKKAEIEKDFPNFKHLI